MPTSSTPLVPDDHYRERDFTLRDLDEISRTNHQGTMKRTSLGKRVLRSLARFFATVLIGVGLTLAWQTHGDEAMEIVGAWAPTWAPSLAWLLPAPAAQKSGEAVASSDLIQQMKLMAVDLAIVRRSVGQLAANQDQLAAKQDQISQNISMLQQVEQANGPALLVTGPLWQVLAQIVAQRQQPAPAQEQGAGRGELLGHRADIENRCGRYLYAMI